MTITQNDSQQTSRQINVTDANGNRKTAVVASCQIRPGRGMTLSIDVLDAAVVNDGNRDDIAALLSEYMRTEYYKARDLGVPIEPATFGADM